jgi:hypothetical protein
MEKREEKEKTHREGRKMVRNMRRRQENERKDISGSNRKIEEK